MKALMMTVAMSCFVVAFLLVAHSVAQGPAKFGDVSQDRVEAEASSGNDWLVAGGGFGEQHFSPLKQITDRNIGTMGLAWVADIDSPMGLATEPIVVEYALFGVGRIMV